MSFNPRAAKADMTSIMQGIVKSPTDPATHEAIPPFESSEVNAPLLPIRIEIWQWYGKTTTGERQHGRLLAPDKPSAFNVLEAKGIWVTSLKRLRHTLPHAKASRWKMRFDQLALQLEAGIDLRQSIEHQHEIYKKGNEQLFWQGMALSIERGYPLSDFFITAGLNRTFPLAITLIKLAEKSGQLVPILQETSAWIEERIMLKRRLTAPLHYPFIVGLLTTIMVLVMLVKVVPVFEGLYAHHMTALPWITQSLFWCSSLVTHHAIACITMLVTCALILLSARRALLRAMHRLPALGPLLINGEKVLILKSLGLSLKQGVPLDQGLLLLKLPDDRWKLDTLAYQLGTGQSFGTLLAQHPRFGPSLAAIIKNGEQTGQLANALIQASLLEKRKWEHQLAILERYLEPMIMVMLSVMLGGIVSALYLPVFDLGQQF